MELASLSKADKAINRLAYYCLRALNRKGGGDIQKAMHLYCLITLLEQLGDAFSRLYCEVTSIHPPIHTKAKKTVELLRAFYDQFYHFSLPKAMQHRKERNSIRESINSSLAHTTNKQDLIALYHLRTISDLIVDIEKFNIAIQLQ